MVISFVSSVSAQDVFKAAGFNDKNKDDLIKKASVRNLWSNEGYNNSADINGDDQINVAECKSYLHKHPEIQLKEKNLSRLTLLDQKNLFDLYNEAINKMLNADKNVSDAVHSGTRNLQSDKAERRLEALAYDIVGSGIGKDYAKSLLSRIFQAPGYYLMFGDPGINQEFAFRMSSEYGFSGTKELMNSFPLHIRAGIMNALLKICVVDSYIKVAFEPPAVTQKIHISIDEAKALFDEAFIIAKGIPTQEEKDELIAEIAVSKASLNMFYDAFSLIALCSSEWTRDHSFEVCSSIASQHKLFDKAIEIAQMISSESTRMYTIGEIAGKMTMSNMFDRALKICRQFHIPEKGIIEIDSRITKEKINELSKKGNFDEAFKLALSIKSLKFRAHTILNLIAKMQASNSDRNKIYYLCDQALDLISSVKDVDSRNGEHGAYWEWDARVYLLVGAFNYDYGMDSIDYGMFNIIKKSDMNEMQLKNLFLKILNVIDLLGVYEEVEVKRISDGAKLSVNNEDKEQYETVLRDAQGSKKKYAILEHLKYADDKNDVFLDLLDLIEKKNISRGSLIEIYKKAEEVAIPLVGFEGHMHDFYCHSTDCGNLILGKIAEKYAGMKMYDDAARAIGFTDGSYSFSTRDNAIRITVDGLIIQKSGEKALELLKLSSSDDEKVNMFSKLLKSGSGVLSLQSLISLARSIDDPIKRLKLLIKISHLAPNKRLDEKICMEMIVKSINFNEDSDPDLGQNAEILPVISSMIKEFHLSQDSMRTAFTLLIAKAKLIELQYDREKVFSGIADEMLKSGFKKDEIVQLFQELNLRKPPQFRTLYFW